MNINGKSINRTTENSDPNFLDFRSGKCVDVNHYWHCAVEEGHEFMAMKGIISNVFVGLFVLLFILGAVNVTICTKVFNLPEFKGRSIPLLLKVKFWSCFVFVMLGIVHNTIFMRFGEVAVRVPHFAPLCPILYFLYTFFSNLCNWMEVCISFFRTIRSTIGPTKDEYFRTSRLAYVGGTVVFLISVFISLPALTSGRVRCCQHGGKSYCAMERTTRFTGMLIYAGFVLPVVFCVVQPLVITGYRKASRAGGTGLRETSGATFDKTFKYSMATNIIFVVITVIYLVMMWAISRFANYHRIPDCRRLLMGSIGFTLVDSVRYLGFNTDWLAYQWISQTFRKESSRIIHSWSQWSGSMRSSMASFAIRYI